MMFCMILVLVLKTSKCVGYYGAGRSLSHFIIHSSSGNNCEGGGRIMRVSASTHVYRSSSGRFWHLFTPEGSSALTKHFTLCWHCSINSSSSSVSSHEIRRYLPATMMALLIGFWSTPGRGQVNWCVSPCWKDTTETFPGMLSSK